MRIDSTHVKQLQCCRHNSHFSAQTGLTENTEETSSQISLGVPLYTIVLLMISLINKVEEKCWQQKLHARYLFTVSKFVQPAEAK